MYSIDNKNEKTLDVDMDVFSLLNDPHISNVETESGIFIFTKDYEHRRLELSCYAYENLIAKGTLNKLLKYFKLTNAIDYITLCFGENNNETKINLLLKESRNYLVPIKYEDDNHDIIIFDNTIHHLSKDTSDSLDDREEYINGSGQIMNFIPLIDTKNNKSFLPLFNTEEEIHKLFPGEKYRICEISYEEALKISSNFRGMIFRPDELNIAVSNDEAGFFKAIDDFSIREIDYSFYTRNEHTIQDKIIKLQSLENSTILYNNYFKGIYRDIAKLDKLYIALSPNEINVEKGKGRPIILNKDGQSAIYIFSELEIASEWAEHYRNFRPDGTLLIGVIDAKDDFNSLFAIALKLDINLCILDETAAFLGFTIKSFMDINNFSSEICLRMTEKEVHKNINSSKNTVMISFNQVPIVGAKQIVNQNYYELRVK